MKMIVGEDRFSRFIAGIGGAIRVRLPSLINRQLTVLVWALAIGLSGCVKYDTGVNFASLNYGEIVQQIQLGEQLNSFSQNAVQTWVSSIEHRTKQAQGQLKRLSDRELQVIIPFNNAKDLVTKIDRYFNPEPINTQDPTSGKSPFNARMEINQSNFLLVVRNHLTYDIDLRSLSIASSDPKVSVASPNFVDLDFSLQSPWGVKNGDLTTNANVLDLKTNNKDRLKWQLKAGQLNHIDAIFWLPNPLGIGAIFIILISIGGYYLKYRQLPWQLSSNLK